MGDDTDGNNINHQVDNGNISAGTNDLDSIFLDIEYISEEVLADQNNVNPPVENNMSADADVAENSVDRLANQTGNISADADYLVDVLVDQDDVSLLVGDGDISVNAGSWLADQDDVNPPAEIGNLSAGADDSVVVLADQDDVNPPVENGSFSVVADDLAGSWLTTENVIGNVAESVDQTIPLTDDVNPPVENGSLSIVADDLAGSWLTTDNIMGNADGSVDPVDPLTDQDDVNPPVEIGNMSADGLLAANDNNVNLPVVNGNISVVADDLAGSWLTTENIMGNADDSVVDQTIPLTDHDDLNPPVEIVNMSADGLLAADGNVNLPVEIGRDEIENRSNDEIENRSADENIFVVAERAARLEFDANYVLNERAATEFAKNYVASIQDLFMAINSGKF